MKISFKEYEGCFSMEITAENQAEAATLVRFGMNRTDKLNSAGTNVYEGGSVASTVTFAKSRHANSDVPKRR